MSDIEPNEKKAEHLKRLREMPDPAGRRWRLLWLAANTVIMQAPKNTF